MPATCEAINFFLFFRTVLFSSSFFFFAVLPRGVPIFYFCIFYLPNFQSIFT